MKKRTKIIAISITLCMCLSMFVVGVLANITVSFNVTSTLNFIADSVYVMAEGEIKLGNDYTSASKPTEIPEGSDYDYIGYSYTPIGSGNNAPIASQAPTGFTDNWEINAINFSSENKVVVYYFKFTNYSNFEVMATNVNNISTVESNLQNQISVQTYIDGAATASKTYNVVIPAKSGETPGTKTLEIVITLTDFMTPITSEMLEFTFTFEKYEDTSKYFNIVNYTDLLNDETSLIMLALMGVDLSNIEYQPNDKAIMGLSTEGIAYFSSSKDIVLPSIDTSGNKIIFALLGSITEVTGVSIKNLTIPEGYNAVLGIFDQNISKIKIPASLQSFCFNNVGSLTTNTALYMDNLYFEVVEGNPYYFSCGGALYTNNILGNNEENNYTLMLVPGANYTLPEIPTDKNVTIIGAPAFFTYSSTFAHRSNFESYEVPSFIENISVAFSYCKDLKTLVVMGDVEANESAFNECSSLQSVIFEGDVDFKSVDAGTTLFYNCNMLQKIVFKGEVANLGGYQLACPSTTKIYLENTITLNNENLYMLTNNYTIQDIYFYQTADASSVLTSNGYTNAGTVSEDGKSYTHFTKA